MEVGPSGVAVLHRICFVGSFLEGIDVPLHLIVDVLVVLLAIMHSLKFFLRLVVEAPLPLLLVHLLLLSGEHPLLVLLGHVRALVDLELLALLSAELVLPFEALSGSLVGQAVDLELV